MKGTLEERFWAKVRKTNTCWLWTGAHDKLGYGHFRRNDKRVLAHRMSWELTYSPIPPGLLICHHCDTPHCVRPDHLFLGTHLDNMADMSHKQRRRQRPTQLLTKQDVITIRFLHVYNQALLEMLAWQYGCSIRQIQQVIDGE